MDLMDTTNEKGRGMINLHQNFGHLRFSGYIQPQFQLASAKGIRSFEGGDFAQQVSNRFMLRRSRIRVDYMRFNSNNDPGIQFVFQFDANERGFTVRDVWGRVFDNKFHLFSFTTGMFARPLGYEVNLSSSDRESPERGRMSQILMKSERDLGAMASFDVRRNKHPLKYIKVDAALFNGQGINASGEFDNTKDVVSRISLKPFPLSKNLTISGGTSLLYGGLQNNTAYYYTTQDESGIKKVMVDSSLNNIGSLSPRRYYGADLQLKLKKKVGFTEIRGEFLKGQQTGTAISSETPTALLNGNDGFYNRNFNGAYFYLVHNIFSENHQLVLKYDWYDPNTNVKKLEIGLPGSGFTAADIKYTTIGLGYQYLIGPNVKGVLYYAHVRNEKTLLPEFTQDVKDDVLTLRLQFRF
jgi:hypothetical protein